MALARADVVVADLHTEGGRVPGRRDRNASQERPARAPFNNSAPLGGGGGHQPLPFSDWAKFFSGPSANQHFLWRLQCQSV